MSLWICYATKYKEGKHLPPDQTVNNRKIYFFIDNHTYTKIINCLKHGDISIQLKNEFYLIIKYEGVPITLTGWKMLNTLGHVGKVKSSPMLFTPLAERKIPIGDPRAYRMLGLKSSFGYWTEGWPVPAGPNRNSTDTLEPDWTSDL